VREGLPRRQEVSHALVNQRRDEGRRLIVGRNWLEVFVNPEAEGLKDIVSHGYAEDKVKSVVLRLLWGKDEVSWP
jgi:hypothetical protein